jgi:hypothetical protein
MLTYWMFALMTANSLTFHDGACTIDVYVVTHVPMPDTMVLDPRIMVTSMFAAAGIPVRVNMRRPARSMTNSCGEPIIVQLDESTAYTGHPDALAYATPLERSGLQIHVFLDRILRGNRPSAFANLLLAHVMVHEISHVLTQSTRHSDEGVMKARWSRQDYQKMRRHPLSLTPEDIACLRRGLAQREWTRVLP